MPFKILDLPTIYVFFFSLDMRMCESAFDKLMQSNLRQPTWLVKYGMCIIVCQQVMQNIIYF